MEWFSDWWAALALVEQILYCIAIPATLILLIQTIMIIAGFGGGGDMDMSGASGVDFDLDLPDTAEAAAAAQGDVGDGSGFSDFGIMSLFTVQGIVTFLCVFGWSGLVMIGAGIPVFIALVVGFALGFLAMFGVTKLIQISGRLAHNGTLNMKNLLGENGTVYLTVPAAGMGQGKVTVQFAERYIECSAVANENEIIPNGAAIRVVDILANNVVVVEKIV